MVTEPVREPHEGIDPYNNTETKANAAHGSPLTVRAGESASAPAISDDVEDASHAPGDEQPSLAVGGGTAAGDPLSGLIGNTEDAVSGDTGPENPGERRG